MLFTLILSFLPLTLASPTKRANPTIQFVNECSVNVQPYITGDNPSGLPNPDVLEPGDAATYTFDQTFVGTIYALEAGVADIEHYIQAGFSLMDNYYWLQTDKGWNIPLGINAIYKTSEGFCNPAVCLSPYCDSLAAFSSPPTVPSGPSNPAPQPPLYECAGQGTNYQVVFCSGQNPVTYVQLHPNGDTSKCMDVSGDIREDGTAVQIYDCNGTPAQNWFISTGETKVMLAASTFCLDASEPYPPDGTKMKIWTCYDGLPQQDWWYTSDNRIALTNQGKCLDLTNGNLADGNQLQVWDCTNGNTNQ